MSILTRATYGAFTSAFSALVYGVTTSHKTRHYVDAAATSRVSREYGLSQRVENNSATTMRKTMLSSLPQTVIRSAENNKHENEKHVSSD